MCKLIFGTGPRLQILYKKKQGGSIQLEKNKSSDLCVFVYYYKNNLKICQYLTSRYFTSRLFKHMEEQKTIGEIRFQNDLRHRRIRAPRSCNQIGNKTQSWKRGKSCLKLQWTKTELPTLDIKKVIALSLSPVHFIFPLK